MAISADPERSGVPDDCRDQRPKPNFPLADQTNRSWREQALTRVAEMRTLADCFMHDHEDDEFSTALDNGQSGAAREAVWRKNQELDKAIHWHLSEASDAAKGKTKIRNLPQNGAAIERAMSNIDAAEAELLRRAPQWGWTMPGHVALCFSPQEQPAQVCPTGDRPHEADLLLIEFVGLVAAAVSGATSLHNATGSATRLGLPIALAVLKLPTGALTAFLGLMLMRGGFVPGLSALDSSPQILAWAILFGAGQQLVTGLIDRQATNVLNQVAGKA